MVFKGDADQATDEGEVEQANTLQAENKKVSREIHQQYGWFFMAKEVADWCNTTFFDIMENRSAMEVFSMVMIIQAKTELEKLKTPVTKHG